MLVLALLTGKWIFGASWTTYLIVGIKMYRRYRLEASGRGDRGNFLSVCRQKQKGRIGPVLAQVTSSRETAVRTLTFDRGPSPELANMSSPETPSKSTAWRFPST